PALDFLIEQMIGAQTENQLVAAARAFDRIMLWNFYHVPGLVRPGYRLTYWDRFGQPKTEPLSRPTYLDTWWWDAERAARVDAGEPIPAGSEAEVAIRAATIWGCEWIARALTALRGRPVTAVEVDTLLWSAGQDKTGLPPYHRTRTIYY
ncbi:MAG: hypothetical protein IIA41_07085, partial [SAR324 cluster bacterium]|nr:hypothetical protein [SAR324 cluster bacterium]